MKVSKYTRLGILIVISLTILIWGLSYLKGNDILKKHSYYNVIYNRVDGLTESGEVTLNGYQVGQVKEIVLLPSGQLMVTLTIDESVKIPINSVAKIVSSDLLGSRSIELDFSNETQYYLPNDTIQGDIEGNLQEQVSMQVLPIKNKAEELLGTIDSAITILTVIFNEDARENLSESFRNINQTIDNLERTTAELNDVISSDKENIKNIISNVEEITTNFKNNTDNLDNIIRNLSDFSDTLSQITISPVLNDLSDATGYLLATLEKLNSDDNTAGLLFNDDELYLSLTVLSNNLSLLAKDIQTNPGRYLHFSAIDLGKEVYINTSGESIDKSIVFKVHLISTETQIPLDSDIFEGLGEVEEYSASGAYSYLLGESNSYTEISELHDEVKRDFPESSVVAFKNGRLIKLERALKSLR